MASKVKSWIKAFRLRTLPLALSCIAMGSFLAATYKGFSWVILVLSLLTTLFLQILSNLANDYGDSVSGVDSAKREGPSRAVQSGVISLEQMKIAIILFASLSLTSGVSLIYTAFGGNWIHTLIFLGLGLLAIYAAITYTAGSSPYGYMGLGDISVFLFFGLIGVLGSFYLHTGYFEFSLILPASSCGMFAVAVLNVNNIRDIESDRSSGKLSIPVRIGREKAVFYHWGLLFFGVTFSLIYVLMNFKSISQFSFLLVTPLILINANAVHKKKKAMDLDPYLKQMAITTMLFVIFFGLSHIL